MIETKATITIVARDDAEADAVYERIHRALHEAGLHATWPHTPIVNLGEVERTHREPTDIEREAMR